MNDLKKLLIGHILDGTTYTGNKKLGIKEISASQVSQDLLVMWLKYKHGYDKPKKIELNTIGTLAHSGLEEIFKELPDYEVETRLAKTLGDWEMTGSIDLLNRKEKYIVDWKVSDYGVIMDKINGKTDKAKVGKDSDYGLQMGMYKYLLGDDEYKAYLGIFNRKQSYYIKDGEREAYCMHEVETYNCKEFEMVLLNKIDKLEHYIKSGKTPLQCDYLGWSRAFTKAKPIRCMKYCNVADNCPYNGFKKDNQKLKLLLGL